MLDPEVEHEHAHISEALVHQSWKLNLPELYPLGLLYFVHLQYL